MNTILKRFISIVLCFVLVAGYLPGGALAEEMDTVQEPSADTTVVVEEEAAAEEESEDTSLTEDDENTSTVGDAEKEVGEEPPADEETETPSEGDEVVTEEDVTEDETVTEEPAEDETVTEEPATEESATEEAIAPTETVDADYSTTLTADVLEAQEDNGVVEIIAASDFQQNAGHEASDSVMEGIIDAVVTAGYTDIDGALFCGDYSNSYTAKESNKGLNYVYGNYNTTWGLTYDDIVFVQGNHDPASTSYLDPSGKNDPESGAYGVFVIHEDDYGWASGDYGKTESEIKATAANLKSYLDEKIEKRFDAPIFVISHLPLHYSMRTYNDGDCRYAQYIFDVLNEASEAGLNIFFLYGHNHSQSFENYHGGGAVFYSAGDEILIGDTTNQKTHHTETIQFTYLNAGYTGRFDTEDTADPTNTATVFVINGNEVVIKRYDANGLHKLKSAGVQSQKYDTEASLYGVNSRVEESPQTIELKQFEEPVTVTHEPTGIAVTSLGLTKLDVTVNDVELPARYSAYVSYDIQPAGYTEGNKATVSIPVDTTAFDASRKVKIFDQKLGTVTDANIESGKVTFTTTHFSTYEIGQLGASETEWTEITVDAGTIFRLVDAMENDSSIYVIANGNTEGNVKVVNHEGGQNKDGSIEALAAVVVKDADGSMCIEAPSKTAQWKYAANTYMYCVNDESYYLRASESNGGFIATQIGSYTNGAKWRYTSANGLQVTRDDETVYYVHYDAVTEDFVISTTAPTANRVYVYKEEARPAITEYVALTGTTTYNLATGAYADQEAVLAFVKQNIAVMVAEDDAGTGAAETDSYTITGTVNPDTVGTYSLSVVYRGTTLGAITVNVADKKVVDVTVDSMTGTVNHGANAAAKTGSILTVTYDDGTTEKVPVTVSMLSGNINLNKGGAYTDLTISYLDNEIEGYTLNVFVNDFPTYPEGGSVKVGKTGAGQDFQNTGIARVELTTAGLPSKKGADVIVMLDTSSSMTSNKVDDGSQTRAEALRSSLQNLINQLKANGADGQPLDIKIAIADFNGYYVSNTETTRPYNLETIDHLKDTTVKSTSDNFNAKVYTGPGAGEASTGRLNASAFVSVGTLDAATVAKSIVFKSGTNYDYAFDAIYQLGEAIQAQNVQNGEERDLFVIFMSDGGPFQYNYFSTQSEISAGGTLWNHWMTGTVEDEDWDNKTHAYFYHPQGKHWMAEAIKGDPVSNYTVIRKDATDFIDVTGDGKPDNYMTQVAGLGAKMYSIGFCAEIDDNAIKAASIQYVLQNIASESSMYHTANNGDDLNGIFTEITGQIRYAAQNARFIDQMGTAFDLKMNPKITDSSDNERTDISTDITVTAHDVYTKEDVGTTVNGHTVTNEDVGKTYGTGEVLETVKFTSDTAATSSALTDENIIKDGVICAKNFWYNTTHETKTITLPSGGTYNLAPETFYWNIGIINEKQFTLSYAVYLTGSMEGTAAENESYDTNNFATLHYTNWLDNEVKQDVPSPALPWGGANVSYAFYLVNEDGEPVDANGAVVPNILSAYKVTQPVLYKSINLNSGETILSTVADDVLPEGYTLYDDNAVYKVEVNSGDGGGSWTITGDKPESTYVTGYAGAQDYSNKTPVSDTSHDYTHTTVYFAVCWSIGTVPDTVVIDYGLPVDISVLANDMFGGEGALAGIGEAEGTRENMTGFGPTLTGEYGSAEIFAAEGKVRFTPADMNMDGYEKFVYAVNYTGNVNPGYYYGDVTVIPATTIYYEDNFVDFTGYIRESAEAEYAVNPNAWIQVGETEDETQSEDRPGKFSLSHIDANNVYGYDPAYDSMSQYSMGSAMKAHVDANSYATATFDFHGTGFDIVGLTSNQTGVLTLKVYKYGEDTTTMTKAVDTYYGYTKDSEGNWITTTETNNALYQVPVLQVENLTYGHYTAVLTADYFSAMDETVAEGYDLYLDAIRIYDPANDGATDNDTVIEDAYMDDNEGWPQYIELRNELIDAASVKISVDSYGFVTVTEPEDGVVNGAVFVDGVGETTSVSDYVSYGPNNELYLNPNQHVIFKLNLGNAKIADVQIAMKAENGAPATYKLCNTAANTDGTTVTEFNAKADTLNSATEQYYSIKVQSGNTITLSNTGDSGILSVTNIKITYTENPANIPAPTVELENEELAAAVMSLRKTAVQEPDTEPTEPDVTEPVETEPVETEPAETEPDVTEPEPTVPETTKPEQDDQQNQNGAFGKHVIEKITKIIKNIFKCWFR